MVTALGVTVPARDLRAPDPRAQLTAVLSAWLPLAAAVLRVVARSLPSPAVLGPDRAERLICPQTRQFSSLPEPTRALQEHFTACSPAGPTIVFVSKMFPVPRAELPGNRARPLTAEELGERREGARARHAERQEGAVQLTAEQVEKLQQRDVPEEKSGDIAFIAFARVYSGSLAAGQELLVLGPKYDPAATAAQVLPGEEVPPGRHVARATIGQLYILLGRDLEPVDRVPAGNVVGIAGLASCVQKSATISSSPWCPPFVPLVQSSVPILRVALEPERSSDLARLQAGLQILNQADAHVEVMVSEAGEMVLATAGEVHLQRCLADLTDEYAGCPITVSEPIVPFRETIVRPPDMDMVNEAVEKLTIEQEEEEAKEDVVTIETPNKQCTLRVRAVALPSGLAGLLEERQALLRAPDRRAALPAATTELLQQLKQQTAALLAEEPELRGLEEQLWSFGPKQCGPNLLLNCVADYTANSGAWPGPGEEERAVGPGDPRAELESSLVQGFQLASLAGPLCEEQMMGVAFLLLHWEVRPQGEEGWGPLSGQIVSAMKEACRRAFSARPARLMVAMYSCQIQVKAEALGKMYNVLARRHGKVVQEDMVEGSSTFDVTAHVPVIESMDFGAELRKQTSGLAMPQLVFSHWQVLEVDPTWQPHTEEELLHFGEHADSENMARRYMNNIRKRKGLKIDEKLVEFAEKQRTITKNK
jgi:ribosome assembly protein 1